MNTAAATLYVDGEQVDCRVTTSTPRPPAWERVPGINGAAGWKLIAPRSELYRWFLRSSPACYEHYRDDIDFTLRRPAALQQIGQRIVAARNACNFAMVRRLADLHLLWSRGEHYYRDMPPSVTAREFSGEAL